MMKTNEMNDAVIPNTNKRNRPGGDEWTLIREFLLHCGVDEEKSSNDNKASELHLSLDAIFYPKFDNEQSDQKIRQQMLSKMKAHEGYIEVSLKHSGSLILWNGTTLYSKNSTNNIFTYTAEILLRQHFAQLWPNRSRETYYDCGAYLKRHQLCLSFECVTALLGQHAEVPHTDFLILTSVASLREPEHFYTTCQLIAFAQQWKLPHNDIWIYTSPETTRHSFDMYDQTRETGLAQDTISQLNQTATLHIPCMYPHCEVQGNILEGLVIRFVEYNSTHTNNTNTAALLDLMKPMAKEAERIANTWKNHKDINTSTDKSSKYFHTTDLRRLFSTPILDEQVVLQILQETLQRMDDLDHTPHPSTVTNDEPQHYNQAVSSCKYIKWNTFSNHPPPSHLINATTISSHFASMISHLVHLQPQESQIHCSSTSRDTKKRCQNSIVTTSLNTSIENNDNDRQDTITSVVLSKDTQTQHIAYLIDSLRRLSLPIVYNIFKSPEHQQPPHWICILQVRHDSDFIKYRKNKGVSSPNGSSSIPIPDGNKRMDLYRGFAIRLSFAKPMKHLNTSLYDSNGFFDDAKPAEICRDSDSSPLMLKMKFLPYMIRTFGFRNGLDILMKSGIIEYENYITKLFSRWNISEASIRKWQPILYSWGMYAIEKIKQQQQSLEKANNEIKIGAANNKENDTPISMVILNDGTKEACLSSRLPLTTNTYLYHLREFLDTYNSPIPQLPLTHEDIVFRALLFVVCIRQNYAHAISMALSQMFRCPCVDYEELLRQRGANISYNVGFVSYCRVTSGIKTIRQLLEKHAQRIIILFLSTTDEELDQYLLDTHGNPAGTIHKNEKKKLHGMSKAWKTIKCANVEWAPPSSTLLAEMETGSSSLTNHLHTPFGMDDLFQKLKVKIDCIPKPDSRPGLLVYFPLIPGSGKSSWCKAINFFNSTAVDKKPTIFHVEKTVDDEEKVKVSALLNGQYHNVVIQMSDQLKGEKYWPFVRREKSATPSSIYIADKNAPPNAWCTVKDIAFESKSYSVGVLPDDIALSSTSVVGRFSENGDDTSKDRPFAVCHSYPFSLSFLAVCMLRVLARPHKSHSGKLDSATENACMVVMQFFSFFRGLTADMLLEQVSHANRNCSIIRVPFFLRNSTKLPEELEECLQSALRLQVC